MKPFKLLAALCCIGLVISCKKEKKMTHPGQFIGLWVESGAKKTHWWLLKVKIRLLQALCCFCTLMA